MEEDGKHVRKSKTLPLYGNPWSTRLVAAMIRDPVQWLGMMAWVLP